jgi:hypothetical protein
MNEQRSSGCAGPGLMRMMGRACKKRKDLDDFGTHLRVRQKHLTGRFRVGRLKFLYGSTNLEQQHSLPDLGNVGGSRRDLDEISDAVWVICVQYSTDRFPQKFLMRTGGVDRKVGPFEEI